MPEELLAAVRQLTAVVTRLEKTLHEDYPKRIEIERRFATQKQVGERRKRWLIGIILGGMIATLFGFFATVSTVSTCFLSGGARSGNAPDACNWLPGYEESMSENERRLKQFEDLLKIPGQNDRRLDRIEKQLGIS